MKALGRYQEAQSASFVNVTCANMNRACFTKDGSAEASRRPGSREGRKRARGPQCPSDCSELSSVAWDSLLGKQDPPQGTGASLGLCSSIQGERHTAWLARGTGTLWPAYAWPLGAPLRSQAACVRLQCGIPPGAGCSGVCRQDGGEAASGLPIRGELYCCGWDLECPSLSAWGAER